MAGDGNVVISGDVALTDLTLESTISNNLTATVTGSMSNLIAKAFSENDTITVKVISGTTSFANAMSLAVKSGIDAIHSLSGTVTVSETDIFQAGTTTFQNDVQNNLDKYITLVLNATAQETFTTNQINAIEGIDDSDSITIQNN